MSSLTIPNTLVAGNTITAAEHNTNYAAIATFLNNLNAGSATWDQMKSVLSTITTLTATTLTATNAIIASGGIRGVTSNTSAAAGNTGEYVESVVSAAAIAATTLYGDVTSISLTAGDWDVTGIWRFAGSTLTRAEVGISSTAGNNATGLVAGSNNLDAPLPTAAIDGCTCIANYRVLLSGTTIYYLKARGTYASGTPTCAGRLSARRVANAG